MFWMVLLAIAGLSGFAFGWLSLQKTPDRVTISFETAKVGPAVEKLKQAASVALEKGREILHSRNP